MCLKEVGLTVGSRRTQRNVRTGTMWLTSSTVEFIRSPENPGSNRYLGYEPMFKSGSARACTILPIEQTDRSREARLERLYNRMPSNSLGGSIDCLG